jgi:tRNA(Ile)-lysidine synthase
MQVAVEHQASWIALAHHADDQVETFLHNLMRGSGPSGLAGIPFSRQLTHNLALVHPLLRTTRSQILEYLEHRGRSFRTDSSNATNQYTRNRIRNELLPMLRQFWSGENSASPTESLDRRLQHASELIAEEHSAIIKLAESWIAECNSSVPDHASPNPFELRLPLQPCVEQCWPVVRHAFTILWKQRGWPLREMGHQHWRRLQKVILAASKTSHPKQIDLPGGLRARCSKGWLQVTMRPTNDSQ